MMKSLLGDGKVSVSGPSLWDSAKDFWGRVVEPRLNRGLQVAWFDRWHNVLDNALRELPEMKGCSHELFRLVMQNPSPTRKRTALVMDDQQPVAVVGLREKGRYWLPAMQGIVPGCIAPAREGCLFPALKALGVDVRIAGWPVRPPKPISVRNVTSVPVFKVDCRGDFEAYWRKSSQMKTVKRARNRTSGFTFEVDRPGSAALIIAKWEEKWRDHPDQQTIIASDVTVAAEYLQQRNLCHTFSTLDGDVLAAGDVCFVYGDELVGSIAFRDNRYDWHGAGNRNVELTIQWAAQHGFAKLDLGGWYSYKARWAPQDGEHWNFRICPLRQHLREQAIWKARAVPGKVRALFRWLPVLSGAPEGKQDGDASATQPQEVPEVEPGNPAPAHSPTAGASTGGDD